MSNITPKIPADNAMPCCAKSFIELGGKMGEKIIQNKPPSLYMQQYPGNQNHLCKGGLPFQLYDFQDQLSLKMD